MSKKKPVEVLIHDTHSYNAIFSQHNIFFDTHKTQKLQLGQVYRLTFVQNHFKGQDNAKAVQFFFLLRLGGFNRQLRMTP